VTVYGSDLDSVADPRITVTVVITKFHDDFSATSSDTRSSSEVVTIVSHFYSVIYNFIAALS